MIRNFTRDTVRVYAADTPDRIDDPEAGLLARFKPEPRPARIDMVNLGSPGDLPYDGHELAVDLVEMHVGNLPAPEPGTRLIVPLPVALAARGRADLLVPQREVRGPGRAGSIVGWRLLASPC